jgi:hypothetical protein
MGWQRAAWHHWQRACGLCIRDAPTRWPHTTQAEAAHMLARGRGKIINTASMASLLVPHPQKQAAYNASKAAGARCDGRGLVRNCCAGCGEGWCLTARPHLPASPAVVKLTQSLAAEWAARGVQVNCVSPGIVNTALIQARLCAARGCACVASRDATQCGPVRPRVCVCVRGASRSGDGSTG